METDVHSLEFAKYLLCTDYRPTGESYTGQPYMFILLQFPFADLRPLVEGELGRMPTPDWTADDPGATFVRGFGKMARQEQWLSAMQVRLWFRRLYFDGKLAGRFEFGFIMGDDIDEHIARSKGSFALDIGLLAAAIQDLPVIVRSLDGAENHAKLATCSKALGCAYLMATTRKSKLPSFPPGEPSISMSPLDRL